MKPKQPKKTKAPASRTSEALKSTTPAKAPAPKAKAKTVAPAPVPPAPAKAVRRAPAAPVAAAPVIPPPPAPTKAASKPAAKAKTVPAKKAKAVKAATKARTPAKRARQAAVTSTPPVEPATPKAPLTRAAVPELSIPSILLEGDNSPAPGESGPGHRYELGLPGETLADLDDLELPEAYGTRRLLLVARDPHWLYAHWDLTNDQLRAANAASRVGHLVLRIFRDQPAGPALVEQHVHPESRNWFVHVGRGGTRYVAQLGYPDQAGAWVTVATSAATLTPPDALSDDTAVRFETIPVEVPFQKLIELVQEAVAEQVPLAEAIHELRLAGHTNLPPVETFIDSASGAQVRHRPGEALRPPSAPAWTPQQARALAEIISIDEVRRVWMGSLEITEVIRRTLEKHLTSQEELASMAAAALDRGEQPAVSVPGGVTSLSSPFGGATEKGRSFWFNVNAELIIYGATEPDAAVTIGGRRIQLRPDGTFSFRFALPDGRYDLPVQATSADGLDSRHANLEFSRATHYRGDVGQHPQDAKLKTPKVEHVG